MRWIKKNIRGSVCRIQRTNQRSLETHLAFVRYLLEEAHANYTYTTHDGINLPGIIKDIQKEAKDKKMVMPPDFDAVVKWLEQKKVLSSTF